MHELTEDTEFGKDVLRNYGVHSRCNEFAWDYASDHSDAVVKVGQVSDGADAGEWHCWVYDAALDRTIDITMFQFGDHGDYWFEDDRHEFCDKQQEFDDREAFLEEWNFGIDSPFQILDDRAA